MRRRTLLAGAGVAAVAAVAGVRMRASGGTPLVLPSAPPGVERVERRFSAARGREVDFYTAVPEGHGAGRGLPVCLVLHGGSKRPGDFAGVGLGRFLTDAVRRGSEPFVLAGATGDRLAWQPDGADDPQRMVREELPAWCAERGFDSDRLAAWGWSMGGYGALLLAETFPGFVRSVAAFSPAVRPGDAVFNGVAKLAGTPVGLWCGRDDSLYRNVRDLHEALPSEPSAGGYRDGDHHFGYWGTEIPDAFDFVAGTLS
ncbi:alpha/beta hydrolase-fold protein [Actinoplanes sp. NPDC024001]|uniref:alpha/beta hydrolase n=1 Tax=Actinoplanes sp. NPDC024001 TaxID=3154598 RepID=UPI0033F1A15C